jgi:hypothetical protein
MKRNDKVIKARARAAEKLLSQQEPELLAILNTLTASEQNQLIDHLQRDESPKSTLRRLTAAVGIAALVAAGCFWQPVVFPVVAVIGLMQVLLFRQRAEIRLKSKQLKDKSIQIFKAKDEYYAYKLEIEKRLKCAISELDEAYREGESISDQLTRAKRECEIFRDEVAVLKNQNEQLCREVGSLRSKLARANEQFENVTNLYRILNAEASHTRGQVLNLTADLVAVGGEVTQARHRSQMAENQLYETTKALASEKRYRAEALQELEHLQVLVLKQKDRGLRGRWHRIVECAMNLKCLPGYVGNREARPTGA